MPRIVALVALPLLCFACTERARTNAPSAPPAPPAARAPAPAAPSSAPPAPAPRVFVAWTEPAGIDALLDGDDPPDDVKDPRSCTFNVPEQSCVPGSAAVDWGCKADCARTCSTCAADCRATLDACKKPCAAGDAACARACGTTAGSCVQACLTARDRCATGDCAARVAAYERDERTKYGCTDKGTTFEICKRAVTCLDACDHGEGSDAQREACVAKCKKTRAAGCNARFLEVVESRDCARYDPQAW